MRCLHYRFLVAFPMKLPALGLKGLLANCQDIWLLPGAKCLYCLGALCSSANNRQKKKNLITPWISWPALPGSSGLQHCPSILINTGINYMLIENIKQGQCLRITHRWVLAAVACTPNFSIVLLMFLYFHFSVAGKQVVIVPA